MKSARFILLYLTLVTAGLPGITRGQGYFVSMDTLLVGTNDVNINDTVWMVTNLYFYDQSYQPVSYSGPVDFWVYTDSMASVLLPPRKFQSDYPVNIDTNGSIVAIPLDLLPHELRVGPNVIIVWPGYALPSITPLDSSEFVLDVDGFLGTDEPDINRMPTYYPNPFQDQLRIQWYEAGTGEITVSDLNGRALLVERWNTSNGLISIPMAGIPPGVYTIGMKDDHNRTRWFKVIKQ